ncbi:hypothetical protein [Nocardia otitidiscaviarum]|uniref:hypothetical protein n=1 Tax=Nocardia otitidiscaviarum TaxID=1823 RepID=UPI001894B7A5|nr:hypothetical protein [Nocardia otitidiscaviarum]MBF6241562.1 hypothetical protein [Nocardia otitidiscaviarum]
MSAVTCGYCSHRNDGDLARCAYCGAPLAAPAPAAGPAAEPRPSEAPPVPEHRHPGIGTAAARIAHDAESAVRFGGAAARGGADALRAVGAVEHGLASGVRTLTERKRYSPRHWLLTVGGLAVLLVCGVFIAGRFSPPVTPIAATTASARLPEPLRAATCRPYHAESGERCVLAAGDPLLRGLSVGRDLTFHVRTPPSDALAATVEQWRSSARTIIADDDVFAAVGPSATVRYADIRTGVVLETGAFDGDRSARSFLERSGLLDQDGS